MEYTPIVSAIFLLFYLESQEKLDRLFKPLKKKMGHKIPRSLMVDIIRRQ
jgi:hypothetical protein